MRIVVEPKMHSCAAPGSTRARDHVDDVDTPRTRARGARAARGTSAPTSARSPRPRVPLPRPLAAPAAARQG
eukprot:14352274-Heterocapsa_arctica.AAC.1